MKIDLWRGDCLELMKDIPAGSVDLILTDPPYGTTACKWDTVIDFELMWYELKRVIKPNGAICLFGSEPFSSHLRLSNLKWFKYDWVWNKKHGVGFVNAKLKPMNTIEFIHVFSDGKTSNGNKNNMPYFPQGLKPYGKLTKQGNKKGKDNTYWRPSLKGDKGGYIQEFTNYPKNYLEFKKDKNIGHPTQKPTKLLEYLISTYTLEGETVLDFTAGSFSTGVAAVNLGRSFIGIELDDNYFDIGTKRIGEAVEQSDFKYNVEILT
jgi:site-specific DNA-methyltransferase (adenine-specific)